MTQNNTQLRINQFFPDWESFLAASEGKSPLADHQRTSRKGREYLTFTGTANFAEALKMARDGGWQEGLRKFERTQAELKEAILGDMTTRQITVHDVSGSTVDIGRYVTGEPENMMEYETEQVEQQGKFLRMVINIAASAGISTDAMIDRGICASVLADVLESSGYRVEIDAVVKQADCCGGKPTASVTVRIKDTEEPMDIDRLLFATAHPSTYRRLMWSVWEATWSENDRKKHGVSASGWYSYPAQETEGDIYIGAMQLWNTTAKVNWIKAELAKLGVEVTPAEAA